MYYEYSWSYFKEQTMIFGIVYYNIPMYNIYLYVYLYIYLYAYILKYIYLKTYILKNIHITETNKFVTDKRKFWEKVKILIEYNSHTNQW